MADPKKAGVKTTEFWLTLAATVLGAVISSGLLPGESEWLKIAGVALVVLSTYGYSSGRAKVKAGNAAGPLLGLLLCATLFAGCVPASVLKQCKDAVVINRGHEHDQTLPKSARMIGQDNADAFEAVLYGLDGTPLSKEAKARSDARRSVGVR